MSRKSLIQVSVIVVMIAGSAFVLYRGFNKSEPAQPGSTLNAGDALTTTPPLEPAAGAAGAAISVPTRLDSTKILPLGSQFDLSLVKKFNSSGNLNNYPKVDPATELNPALNDLVKTNP